MHSHQHCLVPALSLQWLAAIRLMEIVQQVAAQFHTQYKTLRGRLSSFKTSSGWRAKQVIPDLCKYLLQFGGRLATAHFTHSRQGCRSNGGNFNPSKHRRDGASNSDPRGFVQRCVAQFGGHPMWQHTSYFPLQISASKFRLIVAANDTASTLSSSISSWISRRVSAKSKFSSSSSGATPT